MADRRTAVVIGAGPAGLTAAVELAARTDLRPVVLEASDALGGLSRTHVHRGNRIDIGGHRFFSKSERVMAWWLQRLPLQGGVPAADLRALGLVDGPGPDPDAADRLMLVRPRRSRILHDGVLFDYPLRLDPSTLAGLGAVRTARVAASYLRAAAFPVKPERSLQDFLVNRFGRELYRTFFQTYTEKVWGVPCDAIAPDWGAQRVKGLSLFGAVADAARRQMGLAGGGRDGETSLVERFLYPKWGPGQMWEQAAHEIRRTGGEVLRGWKVVQLGVEGRRIAWVEAEHAGNDERRRFDCDAVVSSMALPDLVDALATEVPEGVRAVARGLPYRDFLEVGLLLSDLHDPARPDRSLPDNWIYLHDRALQAARLQVFNNWSPWLVSEPGTWWVGLEFFCNAGDDLWSRPDADLSRLAFDELCRAGFASPGALRDSVVLRVPRAYPMYSGTFDRLGDVRQYLDRFDNLWPVGRNGLHRYNNQDHSMLTALAAVDALARGATDRDAVWSVNAEAEYHEGR